MGRRWFRRRRRTATKVEVSFTVTDDYRRSINRYWGKPGMASKTDTKLWLYLWGISMDDHLNNPAPVHIGPVEAQHSGGSTRAERPVPPPLRPNMELIGYIEQGQRPPRRAARGKRTADGMTHYDACKGLTCPCYEEGKTDG